MEDYEIYSECENPETEIEIFRDRKGFSGYYYSIDPKTGIVRYHYFSDQPIDNDRAIFFGPYNDESDVVKASKECRETVVVHQSEVGEKIAENKYTAYGCGVLILLVIILFGLVKLML